MTFGCFWFIIICFLVSGLGGCLFRVWWCYGLVLAFRVGCNLFAVRLDVLGVGLGVSSAGYFGLVVEWLVSVV